MLAPLFLSSEVACDIRPRPLRGVLAVASKLALNPDSAREPGWTKKTPGAISRESDSRS